MTPLSHASDVAPFSFGGGPRGVLLLHGFTGSPFELRPLGEALAGRGFTVSAPALPGHGPDAPRLHRMRWEDWVGGARAAFDALGARCASVGVAGLSMGGLLTLELSLSRRERVAAVVLMSTALWLPEWQMRGLTRIARTPLLRRLGVPKLGGSDIADEEMRRRLPTRGMPFAPLGQLVAGMRQVRPRLRDVDRPALVMHGAHDHTIPPACTDALCAELRGPVERLALPRSFHVVTVDVERDLVRDRVVAFFDARL